MEENSMQKVFSFNYKEMLLDEIGLEGLEGIETEQLWRQLSHRISSEVTEKMRTRLWDFLVNCNDLKFYQLLEPRTPRQIVDRFMLVCEETGHLLEPVENPDGPYEYEPIENEWGSCPSYKTRKEIPRSELQVPYKDVITTYGHTLVIVASLDHRWFSLAPHLPITTLQKLNITQYCVLELIGRGRENGQISVSNINLNKIVKDPKLLFYSRKNLKSMDLIGSRTTTQITAGRAVKVLLLRLKKFNQPLFLTLPKRGKLFELKEYLAKQPNYSEEAQSILKKGIISSKVLKRLRKTENIFRFYFKTDPVDAERKRKNTKSKPLNRNFIALHPESSESSQSESESTEPLKCQYKVGVNLFRQAYERFLDAGLNGLTQIELAQLLGIEFYTTRMICRLFKAKNLVREFLEDRGRQRTAKYIAVHATKDKEKKYETEKKKFLDFLNETKHAEQTMDESETDQEVPLKKAKIDTGSNTQKSNAHDLESKTIEKSVEEVKIISGLESHQTTSLLNSKKAPTLKQLKFANAVVKIIREKEIIQGYQRLSLLAAREIGEAPMDTKGFKVILQKLMTDGQVKLLRMNWANLPIYQCLLICAPHIKATDPLIKIKYKEIVMKCMEKSKMAVPPTKSANDASHRLLAMYVYPKYLRLQKMHQYLFNLVYNGEGELNQFGLPQGFATIPLVTPELTVAFAIGIVSYTSVSAFAHLKITEAMMNMKLKEVPRSLFAAFLTSRIFKTAFRLNLKILGTLGLVQIIRNNESNETDNAYLTNNAFYLNRRATIIDTTGNWPNTNTNKEDLTKTYRFDTFADTEVFWNDVQNICVKTIIARESPTKRRKQISPPFRSREEVLENDNGQIFGDGLGACGYDSSYFIEQGRYWNDFYTQVSNKVLPNRLKSLVIPKKPRRRVEKKPKQTKKIVPKPMPPPPAPAPPGPRTRRRLKIEDTVKWSKEEDRILMMCKAAVTIMSPTSQPICLRLQNSIAKEILMKLDHRKIATLCHKRAILLETNKSLMYEKDCILNELRRRHLIEEYNGLFKMLRLRYAYKMAKLLCESRVPMLELVCLINRLTKSKSFNRKLPCVAMNIEEFHSKFKVSMASTSKPYSSYRTPRSEPVMSALKEGITMTVIMNHKHNRTEESAQKILNTFKSFPETTLRLAIQQLRQSGTIAARDKVLNAQLDKHQMQNILQESFKLGMTYQRKWICRLNAEFLDKLMDLVYLPLPSQNLKGCPEVNCLLNELQACSVLQIYTQIVPTVTGSAKAFLQEELTDDPKLLNLKSGVCGWINNRNVKTFSDLYIDMDIQTALTELTRNMEISLGNEYHVAEDQIVSNLKIKKENGATFQELQDGTGIDRKTLERKLIALESSNVLRRLGYFENIIVLTEFALPWTMKIDNEHISPVPYATFKKEIMKEVFLKWAGVILNKVFEKPGCSIEFLCDTCELISARAIQAICAFLEKCKCVELRIIIATKPDLFSDDDIIPVIEEFNEYESVTKMLVFPVKDVFTRFAAVKQKILNVDYAYVP